MVRTLLVRGMVAGLIAGLVYFVFAYLFGEASVDAAIAYEERAAAAAGEVSTEVPLVSRGIQATLGLGVAALVYGVVIGGVLSLVYASMVGRVGRLSPRTTAAVIAAIGFVAVALVPFLKYPANPPASSLDDTIGQRTGAYVLLLILSVLFAVAAALLGRRLAQRWETANAAVAAVGSYLLAVGIVGYFLPGISETPADFPATVLYDFRLASIGGHLVLWAVVGLVFGALIDRRSRRRSGQSVDAASL